VQPLQLAVALDQLNLGLFVHAVNLLELGFGAPLARLQTTDLLLLEGTARLVDLLKHPLGQLDIPGFEQVQNRSLSCAVSRRLAVVSEQPGICAVLEKHLHTVEMALEGTAPERCAPEGTA